MFFGGFNQTLMPWENINKQLKAELASIRKKIGIERQSELSGDFERLASLLDENDKNPYDRVEDRYFEQMNSCCPSFREGGHWKTGDLSNSRYFYRIETLESFIRKHGPFFYKGFKVVPGTIIINPRSQSSTEIFESITRDYENVRSWQKLSKVCSAYFAHRGFSWWTNNFDFENKGHFPETGEDPDATEKNSWLLRFAFQVGISSDWLSDSMLFLRLDSQKMNIEDIRIPSIIDAFLQPIFCPRAFRPEERWGLAYDLANDIKPCFREYVIRNIPIDAIEYFPVSINLKTVDTINAKARLNEKLVENLIQNI